MSDAIMPGTTGSATMLVTDHDLASAMESDPGDVFPDVLATAKMIGLMELAASRVMKPLLSAGELSVGIEVAIRHSAPTPRGATVRAEARYIGSEGKRHLFEVAAFDGAGEIGRGTHARAIIERSRLVAGAARRAG
jgi:predicted thioesterase